MKKNGARIVLAELGWTVFVVALVAFTGVLIMNIQKGVHKKEEHLKNMASNQKTSDVPVEKSKNKDKNFSTPSEPDAYTEKDILAQATQEGFEEFKKKHAEGERKSAHKELAKSTNSLGGKSSFIDSAINLYEKLNSLN